MSAKLLEQLKHHQASRASIATGGDNDVARTRPLIHVISTTTRRSVQKPLIHRLANTLVTVGDIHWLLVENADNTTQWLSDVLAAYQGVPVTHLAVWSDDTHYPVRQVNYALSYLLLTYQLASNDVIYFADEESTIDRQLFSAVRAQNVDPSCRIKYIM